MNPIEIGKAIDNYGIAVVTSIILILVVWLVKYLIMHIMGMFKGELKDLHKDSLKNAELNQKSIDMIGRHSKESRANNLKISNILKNLLKSSNGNNPAIKTLISRMDEHEKGDKRKKGKIK